MKPRLMRKAVTSALSALVLLALVLPEAAHAERRRRRIFNRAPSDINRALLRNNFGNRFVNGVNIDNLQQTGFTKIRANGNNLVALDDSGFPVPLFLNSFGRLIGRDRFGRLFNADRIDRSSQLAGFSSSSMKDLIKQSKSFLLKNLRNIRNSASRQAVGNFLARNGAGDALRGGMCFDISNGVNIADKYAQPPTDLNLQTKINFARTSFFLNMISQNERRIRVDQNTKFDQATGRMCFNLNGFVRPEALALLADANPYACDGSVRIDWAMDQGLGNDTIYRELLGFGNNYPELAAQLGIEANKDLACRSGRSTNALVSAPDGKPLESGVVLHNERLITVQSQLNVGNKPAFVTFDNNYNLQGNEKVSASVKANGCTASFAAAEAYGFKPNDFPWFALFNNKNQFVAAAPGEIAAAGGKLGPGFHGAVENSVACLKCHQELTQFGKMQDHNPTQPYTDNSRQVPPIDQPTFISPSQFEEAVAKPSDNRFVAALVDAGAYIPERDDKTGRVKPAALVPDTVSAYRVPQKLEDLAAEIKLIPRGATATPDVVETVKGIVATAASRLIGSDPATAAAMQQALKSGEMSRETIEKAYCTMRSFVPQAAQQIVARRGGGTGATPRPGQPGATPGGRSAPGGAAVVAARPGGADASKTSTDGTHLTRDPSSNASKL